MPVPVPMPVPVLTVLETYSKLKPERVETSSSTVLIIIDGSARLGALPLALRQWQRFDLKLPMAGSTRTSHGSTVVLLLVVVTD